MEKMEKIKQEISDLLKRYCNSNSNGSNNVDELKTASQEIKKFLTNQPDTNLPETNLPIMKIDDFKNIATTLHSDKVDSNKLYIIYYLVGELFRKEQLPKEYEGFTQLYQFAAINLDYKNEYNDFFLEIMDTITYKYASYCFKANQTGNKLDDIKHAKIYLQKSINSSNMIKEKHLLMIQFMWYELENVDKNAIEINVEYLRDGVDHINKYIEYYNKYLSMETTNHTRYLFYEKYLDKIHQQESIEASSQTNKRMKLDMSLIELQIKAENQYFDPIRMQTYELSKEILKRRIGKEPTELVLNNTQIESNTDTGRIHMSEKIITAERSLNKMLKELSVESKSKYISTGWQFYDSNGNDLIEKVKINSTIIQFQNNRSVHYNHLGNYWVYGVGRYEDINRELNRITGTNENNINTTNEQKLAELMLNFSCDGIPVTKDSLASIMTNPTNFDVEKLNRIFYHCLVKEISRRMHPRDIETHELPFAFANARALELIRKGHLNIKDVFSKNARYGPLTDENVGFNINTAREKIERINEYYNEKILEISAQNVINFNDLLNELKKTYGDVNPLAIE